MKLIIAYVQPERLNAVGLFFALKKLGILRVSENTELKGLEIVEH